MADCGFRGELVHAAVEVRLEQDAVLVELAQVCQAESLEAAAVREDRAMPTHEIVKASQLVDHIYTRPQHEMIGVGQENLRPNVV